MQQIAAASAQSEPQFAAMVDALTADPSRSGQLTDLLREDHPIYDQRGAAAIVRMRGWLLLALARAGGSDAALIFVLEELDTGVDAYLVAAAARALRSYPNPSESLAPFVMRALTQIRYRDEPVSFERYGDYAVSSAAPSPVREVLGTLAWLGPRARGVLPELEALRAQGSGLAKKFRIDIDRALHAIRRADPMDEPGPPSCCAPPAGLGDTVSRPLDSRGGVETIESLVFEDHGGDRIAFKEFFPRPPSTPGFFH